MNPSVLIVDGDHANARLLQVLLSLDAIDPLIAHDGAEALTLVASRRIDLVALELRLPDMHGSELALRLRRGARTRWVPLLVLHAVDSDEERYRALLTDVDALIEKPYRASQVRSTVAKLLGLPVRAALADSKSSARAEPARTVLDAGPSRPKGSFGMDELARAWTAHRVRGILR